MKVSKWNAQLGGPEEGVMQNGKPDLVRHSLQSAITKEIVSVCYTSSRLQ